jgi:hypothetical protein
MFVGVRLRRLADAEMVGRPFASAASSSGATHFRRRPKFKKEEPASTLHEILQPQIEGLKQVHHTLQMVRRKLESKRGTTRPEQQ